MREPAGKRIFIGAILLSSGFSSINLKALNVSGSLEPALVFALEMSNVSQLASVLPGTS